MGIDPCTLSRSRSISIRSAWLFDPKGTKFKNIKKMSGMNLLNMGMRRHTGVIRHSQDQKVDSSLVLQVFVMTWFKFPWMRQANNNGR